MTEPPGSGKTMLARALPTILPRLSIDEALDITGIYSIADFTRVGILSLALTPLTIAFIAPSGLRRFCARCLFPSVL